MFDIELMKLKSWMLEHKIPAKTVADYLSVSDRTVHHYAAGTRTPRQMIMLKILALTNGEVTANDFLYPVNPPVVLPVECGHGEHASDEIPLAGGVHFGQSDETLIKTGGACSGNASCSPFFVKGKCNA